MEGDGRPPRGYDPNAHNFQMHYDPNHPPAPPFHQPPSQTHPHYQHQHQHHQHQQHQQQHPPDPQQPSPFPHHSHPDQQTSHTHQPPSGDPAFQDPNAWAYDYNPTSNSPASPNYAWPQQQFIPQLPSSADVAQGVHPQYLQQPFPSNPSVAFQPQRSGSYYHNPTAPSPYAYHASPHPSAYPSPVSRSMSVSAVSNASIEQVSSGPRPSQQSQSQNTFLPTPRQIRFVSTDGQPHAKRRRINAACLTCRKRKTRCSGERPVCKTCTENGHKCAGYADKPSRKESDKKGDDGDQDDDADSAPPSPGRPQPDSGNLTKRNIARSHQPGQAFQSQGHTIPETTARNVSFEAAADPRSPMSNHTAGSGGVSTSRTRVPFFRYFGPTAIVPGFKQMVVQMKDGRELRRSHNSVSGDSPASLTAGDVGFGGGRDASPGLVELPYYDATDPSPNAPLITHLCETFFDHLGCNYPFLQRKEFLKDLAEKRVDAILVNAVCAMAARFSVDPILATPSDESLPLDQHGSVKRAFRGQTFAQRAMSAIIDTFSCPTLAVTQACLLLAYEEFGSDRDSGLWMYLGTSIRMAQDLGIQKLKGLHLEGRLGPTPNTAKEGNDGKVEEAKRAEEQRRMSETIEHAEGVKEEDRRASERERIDTFWAVFFLDRAVSSGVGRPVTLRDKDIEISFPYRINTSDRLGYPDPFPAMIRIVHMYGRVADVLNNIKEVTEVTPEVLKRLAAMERDLTGIYQKLSPMLHFNAANFQHYVKAGQGTNFILLHFWFHTLIVLLHQPTLLHSFEGRIQQLFPDSRELSMSSAKTIADILAFSELIDLNSFIGNPFTSQPVYVAACAFLAEAVSHASQPPSRGESPSPRNGRQGVSMFSQENKEAEQKMAAKHTLLASAANQNYQRCYKALKTLDHYWAGCRYILTALDQKAEGLASPLLFTSEDVNGEMPSTEPSFTTPGWRRTAYHPSLGGPVLDRLRLGRGSSQDSPWSPKLDYGQAIGWAMTGTGNSPAPNLSFLYQNSGGEASSGVTTQVQQLPTRAQQLHPSNPATQNTLQPFQNVQASSPSPSMLGLSAAKSSSLPYDPVSTAEADLLLGLHSPYSVGSSGPTSHTSNPQPPMHRPTQDYTPRQGTPLQQGTPIQQGTPQPTYYQGPTSAGNYDMFIESQDVDISNQQSFNFNNFSFPGSDMIPWLEYLPQDVLNYFADSSEVPINVAVNGGNATHGDIIIPSGPGPPQDHSSLGPGGQGPPNFRTSHTRGASDGP